MCMARGNEVYGGGGGRHGDGGCYKKGLGRGGLLYLVQANIEEIKTDGPRGYRQ